MLHLHHNIRQKQHAPSANPNVCPTQVVKISDMIVSKQTLPFKLPLAGANCACLDVLTNLDRPRFDEDFYFQTA